jgi:cell division protein FtsN
LQSDELQRRCVGVPTTIAPVAATPVVPTPVTPTPVVPTPVTPPPVAATPVAGSGRYSVQLAAYDTRAEAAAAVQRFTQRDIAARVDGDQKPFRVRVGYYATRAEAVNALNRLKKLGLDGFVAERAP